jgi:DUF4097 and DUF4098 domain-containing protein YvlB
VFTTTAAFAADGNFDRTLTVNGSATLNLSTGAGYIHVYPGSGNQVHIVGHVHSRQGISTSDAERAVSLITDNPPIQQSGNTITVAPPRDKEDLYKNVIVDYDVTAPAASTLAAHTGSGKIEIGGIQGTVSAGTGSGEIHVDNIGGNARLQTGSGQINAINVHGAATAQTGSGQINLAVTAPGDIKAQTGSGGMHVTGVSGSLRADSGSGSIDIDGNPTGDWNVQTGSGGIHLQLTSDARLNLDAASGSGGIHVERPIAMQTSDNKHHVTGTINGGGPAVHLRTGSGGIAIH